MFNYKRINTADGVYYFPKEDDWKNNKDYIDFVVASFSDVGIGLQLLKKPIPFEEGKPIICGIEIYKPLEDFLEDENGYVLEPTILFDSKESIAPFELVDEALKYLNSIVYVETLNEDLGEYNDYVQFPFYNMETINNVVDYATYTGVDYGSLSQRKQKELEEDFLAAKRRSEAILKSGKAGHPFGTPSTRKDKALKMSYILRYSKKYNGNENDVDVMLRYQNDTGGTFSTSTYWQYCKEINKYLKENGTLPPYKEQVEVRVEKKKYIEALFESFNGNLKKEMVIRKYENDTGRKLGNKEFEDLVDEILDDKMNAVNK